VRDTDLYQAVLGIAAPWRVVRVELALDEGRVDVWVEHGRGERFACPQCDKRCAVYDHSAERVWRHLDTCQYKTLLHASPPRVRCVEHGVKQAAVPWSDPRSGFTALFERFAIDVLLATDVSKAANILRITWEEAWGIKQRAVARGQARRSARGESTPTKLGVDEKSPGRGAEYFTVVSDLESKTVTWIGDGRKGQTLDEYWNSLSASDLTAIECIAMDMSNAYFSSAVRCVPNAGAKVVYDRFHVMQLAGKAVDQVRRNEVASFSRAGEDSPLTKTRYMWLYSEENLPEKYADRFAELRASDLKTAKAWGMKELLRRLWSIEYKPAAGRFLSQFIRSAKAMKLSPLHRLAGTLATHRQNILTYIDHGVTSATCEGLNSAIQAIKHRSRGFRNRENFKTAIYFELGGLDLYPALSTGE
jgi:transposase